MTSREVEIDEVAFSRPKRRAVAVGEEEAPTEDVEDDDEEEEDGLTLIWRPKHSWKHKPPSLTRC